MAQKVYIKVFVMISEDGIIKPLQILWEDGRIYDIDRIIDVKPRAATKVGGHGLRYECRIRNQTRFIFNEEQRWFMEVDKEGL